MLLTIAWKNVWRNKLRSLIVIFAVMIGLLAGSFGAAVMEGLSKKRAKSAIHNEISHLQIHHKEFQENYEAKFNIPNSEEIETYLSNKDQVVNYTERIIVSGMLSTSRGSSGGFIYGIDPEIEKQVTEIYTFVKDSTGTYLDSSKKNQVLISETTAKKLKIDRYRISDFTIQKLSDAGFPEKDTAALYSIAFEQFRTQKDYFDQLRSVIDPALVEEFEFLFIKYAIEFKDRARIVISFQDKDGNITGEKFRVCGIYKTSNRMFDEMAVFVNKNDLARITGYDINTTHEIAVMLTDREIAKDFAKQMKEQFPDLKIESWGEIDPMLIMLAEYMGIYNYILLGIILAALAFGIVNTMLMAVMERTKELGMLAAIGMNRKRVFNMIMVETIFLTIVGAVFGMAVNFLVISHFSKAGFDLTKAMGEAFEAIGYDTIIYPELGPETYIGFTILVIFAAVLSSIYPALKAIRLNPAEAVRTDA
jgi:putative ABC transport system permease protein